MNTWTPQEILVVVLAQLTGLAAAAFCTFIGVLYIPEISVATYRPTAAEHAIGVAAVVVGSVMLAAGPLVAWFLRRRRAWLATAGALMAAGAVCSIALVRIVS
jgi:hypothetical protein